MKVGALAGIVAFAAACGDSTGSTADAPASDVGDVGGGSDSTVSTEGVLVPGGTFFRRYDGVRHTNMGYPATVSAFKLDRYEVTVARFRAFVAAGYGTQQKPPAAGAGGRMLNGMANQGGWDATWNASLPADTAALVASLKCGTAAYQTWTDAAGANEMMPINCVSWFEANAFCIWDGGFLPTDAESHFAAEGGSEQRVFPWSVPASDVTLDGTHSAYFCLGDGDPACAPSDLFAVGQKPAGDGRWTHADLSGNVEEWVLDCYAVSYPTATCDDCADLSSPTCHRLAHGGGYDTNDLYVDASAYNDAPPERTDTRLGLRCARRP